MFLSFLVICLFGLEIYAEDCLRECYNYDYNGIRSSDISGYKCLPWTPEMRHVNKISNFCTMDKESRPWCYTASGWNYCNIPKCSYKGSHCATNIRLITTDTSTEITWSNPWNKDPQIRGYIILLHHNNKCLRSHKQTRFGYHVFNDENNLYSSCEQDTNSYHHEKQYTFDNLQQDTDYVVYIVVIIERERTEAISRISIRTQKSNPFDHYLEIENIVNTIDMEDAKLYMSISPINTVSSIISTTTTKQKLVCPLGDLIPLFINIEWLGRVIKVPFNISCGLQDPINVASNLANQLEDHLLHIYWNVTEHNSHNYLIYWINSNIFFHRYVNTKKTEFILPLNDTKNTLQICVGTIDTQWRTGKYMCTKYLYSPGPVIHLNGKAASKSLSLQWQTSKEDTHYGYIVNVTSFDGRCQTVIINMKQFYVNITEHCKEILVTRWRNLQSLKITNLIPDTTYNVTIYSINGNNTSKPNIVTLTTTKEESIKNLHVFRNKSHLLIKFDGPQMCNKVIMKYRVKVVMTNAMLCNYSYNMIYDDVINDTRAVVLINEAFCCFRYQVKVFPVRDCVTLEDIGQTESNVENIQSYYGATMTKCVHIPIEISKSLSNLDITLMSVNLMRISWTNSKDENECNNFGMMIESMSEANNIDCKLWIITRTTCSSMVQAVRKESACDGKEYLRLEDHVVDASILLHGQFRVATNYSVKVWTITDVISLHSSRRLKYGKRTECFNDCYDQSYSGIRSGTVDGRFCLHWNLFSNTTNESYRSNICHFNRTVNRVPWCIYGSHAYHMNCAVPRCRSEIMGGRCLANIETISDRESVTITLPSQAVDSARGYIVLLHGTGNLCERYLITTCTNCIHLMKLTIQIQSFFISCRSGSIVNNMINKTKFNNLRSNEMYSIYVIPLIDHATVGYVHNLTVATRASDSRNPHTIRVTERSANMLKMSWKSYRNATGPLILEYYNASLVDQRLNTESSNRCIEERVEFFDLDPCTRYCLYLYLVYNNGRSALVDMVCTQTSFTGPGLIKLYNIDPHLNNTMIASWAYLGSDHCPRYYRVEIKCDYLNKTFDISTNDTVITLDGLETDVTYQVRVRTEMYDPESMNVTISNYSDVKVFFVGQGLGRIRVDDIESEASSERNISWKYGGIRTDRLYYRLEYNPKYQKEMKNVTTNRRYLSIYKLKENMIYSLRVRAETNESGLVGNYSDSKEFFSGQLNKTISNVISVIDSTRKLLNVFWTLDDTTEGSIFEFVLRVTNVSDDCVMSVNFICDSPNEFHNRKYIGVSALSRWVNMIKCSSSTVKRFKIFTELFGGVIRTSLPLVNSTLGIYGLNLMGVHKLHQASLLFDS